MAKVTSKLQVTIPKALANQYGIDPGDQIRWEAAGDAIRVVREGRGPTVDVEARLRVFDQATRRQRARQRKGRRPRASRRGWTREELYERGRAR
jgi:AbrB family looped-hinge helix DNA binding protein